MGQILAFPPLASGRHDRASLAGLIVVPQIQGGLLTEADLRTDAESLLEEAGVPTFTETDADALPYAGYLGVSLATAPDEEERLLYSVGLEVVQAVKLLRPGERRIFAVTW